MSDIKDDLERRLEEAFLDFDQRRKEGVVDLKAFSSVLKAELLRPPPKGHGANENQIIGAGVAIAVGLVLLLAWQDPSLALVEVGGKYVQRLAFFFFGSLLFLYSVGGRRFQLVEKLKAGGDAGLIGLALIAGAFISGLGAALGK